MSDFDKLQNLSNYAFDAFRATGRDVADLAKTIGFDHGDDTPIPGRVYLGGLYCEKNDEATRDANVHGSGDYCAMIGRDEYYGTLTEIEFRLYVYGIAEGVFNDIDLHAMPRNADETINGVFNATLLKYWPCPRDAYVITQTPELIDSVCGEACAAVITSCEDFILSDHRAFGSGRTRHSGHPDMSTILIERTAEICRCIFNG